MASQVSALEFFATMGNEIARRWKKFHYDTRFFSQVSCEVLEHTPPSSTLSFEDVVQAGFAERLPVQADIDATFGQPPLTVYSHNLFRIETLFWIDGVPGIHQHGFSGGFHVLHGSSLHTEWTFTEKERVCGGLLLGRTQLVRTTLLTAGSTCPIRAGRDFIHSTFHLDRPSVTVVARTTSEDEFLPQFSYWPPTLAYAPGAVSGPLKRRLQMLQMLARSGRTSLLRNTVADLIAVEDPLTIVHILVDTASVLAKNDHACLIQLAKARFPSVIGHLIPALSELERRGSIAAVRKRTVNADLQFFLSLALNLNDRELVISFIRDRYPGCNVVEKLVGWTAEMDKLHPGGLDKAGEWIRELHTCVSGKAGVGYLGNADSVLARHWLLGPLLSSSHSSTCSEACPA